MVAWRFHISVTEDRCDVVAQQVQRWRGQRFICLRPAVQRVNNARLKFN
jgi:hypothetical protein